MDDRQNAQLLWRAHEATVERHVTATDGRVSVAFRTRVTLSVAPTARPGAALTNLCPDLELGAHVALIHARVPGSPGSQRRRESSIGTGDQRGRARPCLTIDAGAAALAQVLSVG
jgi:hypothetical protein